MTYAVVNAVPQVKCISLTMSLAFGTHTLHTCFVRRCGSLTVVLFAVLLNHGLLAHGLVAFVGLHAKNENQAGTRAARERQMDRER